MDSAAADDSSEPLDEVREAAGEVVESLKKFIKAAEKVVADPAAFDQIVAGGKGLFDAFTGGYSQQATAPDPDETTRSEP